MDTTINFQTTTREDLAARCRNAVDDSGLTQTEVADLLGCSQAAIYKTFKASKHVDSLRVRLLRELGVETDLHERRLLAYAEMDGTGYVIFAPEGHVSTGGNKPQTAEVA